MGINIESDSEVPARTRAFTPVFDGLWAGLEGWPRVRTRGPPFEARAKSAGTSG